MLGITQVFFVIAMLAACVASQAMISGAFQIIKQSINLGCFPRLTVKSVSKTVPSTYHFQRIHWDLQIAPFTAINASSQ